MPRGNPKFIWTEALDEQLRQMVRERALAREISAELGCSEQTIHRRVRRLEIGHRDPDLTRRHNPRRGRPMGEHLDKPEWSIEQLQQMHRAFATAMIAAIKRGKEHAPMGVVKKPGTSRTAPTIPPVPFFLTQSVAADCVAFAGR